MVIKPVPKSGKQNVILMPPTRRKTRTPKERSTLSVPIFSSTILLSPSCHTNSLGSSEKSASILLRKKPFFL